MEPILIAGQWQRRRHAGGGSRAFDPSKGAPMGA